MVPLRGVVQKTPLVSDPLSAQEVFRHAKTQLVIARLAEDLTQLEWWTQFVQMPQFKLDVHREWSVNRKDACTHALSAWVRMYTYRKARRAKLFFAPFVDQPERLTPLKHEQYELWFGQVMKQRLVAHLGNVDVSQVKVFLWRSQRLWGVSNKRHYTVRVKGTVIAFYTLTGERA